MSVLSKRSLTAISCMLMVALTASAALAAPAAVTDVPTDHWAYEAVTLLVDKGYMGVYESGQFKGDDSVSRYLLAFVAARLLRDMESGRTTLTDDDMRVVRELSVNLREQLAVITGRLAQLEKVTADAASGAAIASDNTARMAVQYAQFVAAMEEQLKQIREDAAARAGAGDQKLTALYADSKRQIMEGEQALRQELAVVSAKADSIQASALAAVESEAQSRQDLESRLSLSIDGLKAQDGAQQARIDQLTLKLDEVAAAGASTRAWVESAIAGETSARQSQVASLQAKLDGLTKIQDNLAESSALALGAAVEAERRDREAADSALRLSLDELDTRVAGLEKSFASETSSLSGQLGDLEKSLTLATYGISGELAAERTAREADVAGLVKALGDLTANIDALAASSASKEALERAAAAASASLGAEQTSRQEEARCILADLADARREITDLERKTAEADAAILAGLAAERARIDAVVAEIADVKASVALLQDYAQTIDGGLGELAKKHGSDYLQQRQALIDLQVALDKLSKTLSDRIEANAAEDLRTGAKVVENAMDIRKVVDALNETRQALNATAASAKEAHAGIAEANAAIDDLNTRLESIETMLQGSVDELKRRFADDLVAERWEAEAREVRLQSMIEELQSRVERLEGQRSEQPDKMSSGAIIGVLAVVAAIVAAIAIGSGGSK